MVLPARIFLAAHRRARAGLSNLPDLRGDLWVRHRDHDAHRAAIDATRAV